LTVRSAARLLTAALACILVLACWRAPVTGSGSDPLDPALRRMIAAHPDSVVGLLIRTAEPLTDGQRRRLQGDSIAVGSVVGTIVTARARARDAAVLADLPFVVHVQLAATVPIHTRLVPPQPAPQFP
jgi:hypothetical protein